VAGPRHWFLDEITSVKGDWPSVIKNLRDNDPGFALDTVVLTGSSAAGLHEARKSLAGRRGEAVRADRAMLPMRFTDVVAAAGLALPAISPVHARDLRTEPVREAVGALLPFLNDLISLWEAYLRVGGFPRAVATWLRDGDVSRAVVDALWDVVYGDAITSARFAATQTQTLLAGLARGLCSPVNVSNLARDVATTQPTMTERLTDLADHFLIWPCHREQDGLARPAAQRKWYFIDPLLARLAALRGAGNEPDLTQLTEQQLGITLLRNTGAEDAVSLADFDAVLHYRSVTDAEIDFVGARMGDVAVESKYTDGNWGRELQTIRASRFRGVLASRSGVEWRDDTWVIPAPILTLLLGG
jgi:predicted AAA+ superfamily ATPase